MYVCSIDQGDCVLRDRGAGVRGAACDVRGAWVGRKIMAMIFVPLEVLVHRTESF
jgi:hypothetical protein